MRSREVTKSAQRHLALCVVALLTIVTSGCGSDASPPRQSQLATSSSGIQFESSVSQPPGLATQRIDEVASSVELPVSPPSPANELIVPPTVDDQPLAAGISNMVEVFYATDRLPTAQLLPSTWRNFAPVGVVWMICAALLIGFTAARRFAIFWLMSCGLALCLGVMVLHTSIIRWQQFSRLALHAETRYSSVCDILERDYPLHLGSARVSLPANHKPGRFEQPELFQFEFVESVDKHIVLHSLKAQESSDAWFDGLSAASLKSNRRDGFVFVHGYNVRFIDALKRTAQLANDLELAGPAICYSWPSRGEVAAYTTDEASVAWSAPHFERLLLDLRARTKCERIHVVAHSMGNRALLQAIESIDAKRSDNMKTSSETKIIDSLVMAAPDVDLAEFTTRYVQPLSNISDRTTLYFSDGDRALLLSARLHGAPRLGLIRDHLQAFAGIESIYVGARSMFSLGHSYYGDDPAVIEDLKALLRDGRSAADRVMLTRSTNASGNSFWKIDRTLQARLPAAQSR